MTDRGKKEISRIRQRIDKFVKMGDYGFRDYVDYIDTLIKTGKVDYFNYYLETFHSIDYTKFTNIIRLRDYAWYEILLKTNPMLLESIDFLYKRNNVYQIGNEIRKSDTDEIKYELSQTLDTNRQIMATSSKIGFTFSGDKLLLDIIDNHVNKVTISRVDWATYSAIPTNKHEIQTIESQKYYETITYTASVPSGVITNLYTYTNSLNIGDVVTDDIYKIDLNINVEYTTISDLNINLKSPNGRIINVKKYILDEESGTRYNNVTFTSENKHGNLYHTGEDVDGGTYSMDKFLNTGPEFHVSDASRTSELLLNNKNIPGDWTLSIKDYKETGFGSLLGWSLSLGKLVKGTYLTQSQYETNINTQLKSTYLVEVEKRNPYGKFLYMLNVDSNNLLGTINEVNISNLLSSIYHIRSKKVMEALGIEKTFLEATRYDTGELLSIISDNPKLSEERNLYERYVQALNFLLS